MKRKLLDDDMIKYYNQFVNEDDSIDLDRLLDEHDYYSEMDDLCQI